MVQATQTAFGQVIVFLDGVGFFSVILPFLLVFAITYAILEKTAILGGTVKDPKHNLNAIVAFTIGFFVIASAPLVGILEDVLAKTILLLIGGIALMITISVFSEKTHWFNFEINSEGKYTDPRSRYILWATVFFVLLIFLGSIKMNTALGTVSVLNFIIGYIIINYQTGLISSLLLFALMIFGVHWMSKSD